MLARLYHVACPWMECDAAKIIVLMYLGVSDEFLLGLLIHCFCIIMGYKFE